MDGIEVAVTLREGPLLAEIERLRVAIEDALQIAVMEQRDLNMEPWASLQEALDQPQPT